MSLVLVVNVPMNRVDGAKTSSAAHTAPYKPLSKTMLECLAWSSNGTIQMHACFCAGRDVKDLEYVKNAGFRLMPASQVRAGASALAPWRNGQ